MIVATGGSATETKATCWFFQLAKQGVCYLLDAEKIARTGGPRRQKPHALVATCISPTWQPACPDGSKLHGPLCRLQLLRQLADARLQLSDAGLQLSDTLRLLRRLTLPRLELRRPRLEQPLQLCHLAVSLAQQLAQRADAPGPLFAAQGPSGRGNSQAGSEYSMLICANDARQQEPCNS